MLEVHDVSDDPPIDPTEPMATQSRQALMIANEQQWRLTYHHPVDMRDAGQVARLRGQLGDAADLPNDDGLYYLVYVQPQRGDRFPMLIPEGDARAAVFVAAALRSRDDAGQVCYRKGILPL